MSPAGRLRLVGMIAAVVETVLGLLLVGTVLAPYFWATAVLTLAVTTVAGRFMTPPPPPGDDGGAVDPEPPWWPGFEAELRAYEQDRRQTLTHGA